MSEYEGGAGDLSEAETLTRLTAGEKKRLALPAIVEFPHIGEAMVDDWLSTYGCYDGRAVGDYDPSDAVGGAEPAAGAENLLRKALMLVDCLEDKVESGEDPEALDYFLYGQVYPAVLREEGIDPDEVAAREAP